MIHIACLKWGDKYPAYYVNRLFEAVDRNTTIPFSFHCFTNETKGINPLIHIIPLKYTNIGEHISGWWFKPYMFCKDNYIQQLDNEIVYIDLDTVITGNIDKILQTPVDGDDLVILRDFFKPQSSIAYQSSLMKWKCGAHSLIWENFYPRAIEIAQAFHPHGDQKLVEAYGHNTLEKQSIPTPWRDAGIFPAQKNQSGPNPRKFWQDYYPEEIVSFKINNQGRDITTEKIICFHGKPAVHDVCNQSTAWQAPQGMTIRPNKWIAEHWIGGNV